MSRFALSLRRAGALLLAGAAGAASVPSTSAQHGGHAAHVSPPAESPAFVHSLAPHLPMTADGSGTGWLPSASPMEMLHTSATGWALGLHAAAFPRVTAQDVGGNGARGATSVGAPNWAMVMAQRPVGGARLTLRAMVSLDPLTEGGNGYPLLFQTGETFEGERLVDRQHPHDAVSELSATVAAPLGRIAGQPAAVFAYTAFPGEPALGPVAFMHRPSARYGPDAPLSHHWQDATHIVWGVATGGIVAGPLKLDASAFTGREPDESRWAPDRPRFDSFSARLSASPAPAWTVQVSRGWITEPEALEPGVDQTRTTASVLYGAPLGADGDATATLAWGRNAFHGSDGAAHTHTDAQDAWLAEGTLRRGRLAVYGRAELVDKSTEELALDDALGDAVYRVAAGSLGVAAEVGRWAAGTASVGTQVTAYRVPDDLRPLYGAAPVSVQVFVRLAPPRMRHGAAHGHP